MRAMHLACALVLLWSTSGGSSEAASRGGRLHIVPPHASVAPGGSVQFRDVPPAANAQDPLPPRLRVSWSVSGGGEIRRDSGLYLAPLVVPAGGSRARIVVFRGTKTDLDSAEALVDLLPGSVAGAEDCLGPGQAWSASGRGVDYVFADELPEPTTRVAPEYPRWASARRLAGSLVVNVLVCRSGRVLDAYTSWPEGATAIPELDELAIAAARQWTFRPARVGGQPVATQLAIPFVFPPR